ncbi:MAG: ribosomal L7Ae/L30e/S12e/Gadd45 family protein [Lachnospiraceae bacterium]|nr:ribosomal L7Ae/L30e/S12e/Gadd45 family protein [Lachnospiraceae bacterium]
MSEEKREAAFEKEVKVAYDTKEYSRLCGYIGLAARARKLESGEFAAEQAVKNGKARLVIVAEDASSNTKKKFGNMCTYRSLPCALFFSKEQLGRAIGQDYRAVIAVTDEGLAKTAMSILFG